MKLLTRDFGEVEISEEDIVTFVQPMFGFDTYRKYVFLCDQNCTQIVWLQSVEEPGLCFVLVAPDVVLDDYHPKFPAEVLHGLGDGEPVCWLVMVVAEEFRNSTVNLKSPVIVNHSACSAAQVILEDDLPIRYPFSSRGKGKG